MALAACIIRIVEGRVGVHAGMGRLFIAGVSFAAMAIGTGDAAMFGFKKSGGDKDFFEWLQRNHSAASAGSRLQRRFLPLFCRNGLFQHLDVKMAGDAA